MWSKVWMSAVGVSTVAIALVQPAYAQVLVVSAVEFVPQEAGVTVVLTVTEAGGATWRDESAGDRRRLVLENAQWGLAEAAVVQSEHLPAGMAALEVRPAAGGGITIEATGAGGVPAIA